MAALLSSTFGAAFWFNYAGGGVLLLSAMITFFDMWPGARPEKGIVASVDGDRFLKLLGVGFFISSITLIDDFTALSPLYDNGWPEFAAITSGVAASTILQIIGIIYFAEFLDRVPKKRYLASAALALYAVLVMTGVV